MADKYTIAKRIGLAVGTIALLASFVIVYLCWSYPETTVIVLRHAEKVIDPNLNDDVVPLSDPDGIARAGTLAEILERSGVSVIYVTQKLRSQQTAAPLASSRGITPTRYTYGTDADINNLITDVLASKNRGRVIVIVGHNDSVPTIVERLGGGTVAVGNQFDNLFVLRVNSWTGTANLIKATYGAPR